MHKQIVEQIQHFIENTPWRENVIVYIQPKPTGGFWAMAIKEKGDGKTYLPHVLNVALAIGRAHGEGLTIQQDGRWLEFD